MRKLLAALFVLFPFWAMAQPLVGPVPEPLTFSAATYTESTKPVVTPSLAGSLSYISDCQTGTQGPPGTGCMSYVNSNGIWVDIPSPPSTPITIGSQALILGQTATTQGNGPKIQLATGSATSGHAVTFDASGNLIDSGSPVTGSGIVSNSTNAGVLSYYSSIGTTVVPLASVANAVVSTNGSNVVQISTTLPTGLTIGGETLTLANSTIGNLPAVTSGNAGQVAFATDCRNGIEGGGLGSGCLYIVNDAGTWTPYPALSTQTIIVGGQTLNLTGGQATTNQGTGAKVQLSTGSATNGHCVQFDATGNTVDAGGACTTGGGGGTVSSGTANQLTYYASTGTVVAGLSTTNNAVLITNGSGAPSESATLPSGLTIPAPTVSNPNITGTETVAAETLSGNLSTAASVAGGANVQIPQGTAPSSPANGNVWATSSGLFGRYGGTTIGPYIGAAQLSGTAPIVDTAGAFSCPTCGTSGTAPITVSGGVIALGVQPGSALINFDSATTVHNDTYYMAIKWPWATGTITSVDYFTGGSSTPSFSIALQIAGVNVTSCNAITVSSSSPASTTCTAANAITTGQALTLVITSTSGSPFSSGIQVHYTRSAS